MSLLTICKPAPTATHTSPAPGITALFYRRVFQWLVVIRSSYSNLGRLLWGGQYCTGRPVSTEQGEEISDNGYDPCVFAYLVHGSPHPVERSQRQRVEAAAWFVIMVRAGTPADTLQKINAVTSRYFQSARGQELIAKQAVEAGGGTPADAAAFVKLEVEKWEPVIKAANISLN
jgi:hypothetical protein